MICSDVKKGQNILSYFDFVFTVPISTADLTPKQIPRAHLLSKREDPDLPVSHFILLVILGFAGEVKVYVQNH